ncbi:response regulator transcription factor [Mucilaginibacter rubeus]|uniref:Response regulator transcription factor n=1 Tax=Mucilaginibacter rubeus TaxID=2027860 RepID=A0A5C1HT83_9SPHI|nr:response regulator transcription factor [Mucilaginibacter rubeus]QEM09036.1 response regulator transcription factor [Mucilaginibacter rubeus]
MISAQKPIIKLAIVDDHNLFRKGLIKLVHLGDTDDRYTILFEAENGIGLRQKLRRKELPDIILMDIAMPGMDGYETVDWLQKYYSQIKVLFISMLETEEAVLRMLHLKVKGFLSKDIEVEDMHLALEAIANNGCYYSNYFSGVAAELASKTPFNPHDGRNSKYNSLNISEREREFLKHACTDLTYQQIADKMSVSHKTVDGYREALFQKFNVKNRVTLALFAVKNGYAEF